MNKYWRAIHQLDISLKEWQETNKKYGMPSAGWLKTIRVTLCMTLEQLANRLGLSAEKIKYIEKCEIHDKVTLQTLREVANAMECRLVYAIVPKNNFTLEDIIRKGAEQTAREKIARMTSGMSLEAQSTNAHILKEQQKNFAEKLFNNLGGKFWATVGIAEKLDRTKIKDADYYKQARKKARKDKLDKKIAKSEYRSIPNEIEYWAMVGKCAIDNPDLPINFIKELLVSKNMDKTLAEPFILNK